MSDLLPGPVGEYFAAANERAPDRVAACFAPTATVRDEGREIRGRRDIRNWAQHTGDTYGYTATVTAVEQTPDLVVVTAKLVGEFPGSPIDLRYRFALASGLIARLEIGR